ncbi:hypothetical protein LVB87_13165 [Lysobacter sp. KIS68-7]|uniref:hypothetical protein n=1 Tax=Lysobacter sp. KIS68-7 TaxID=2904252 RepID=UPI001E2FD6D1|nr:hypothetical protein [Lysobacter sp. KIS68-7]UHQ19124.1 hypothetical protein LVB87_13165 [Lysobacter sp. KIS68-7]
MNRKLHNTVTALFATTGLLVLGLMAANPVRTAPAPLEQQVATTHVQEASKRIEARAAELQARLAQSKNGSEAIGEIAGFAAEAATLAAIAAAFDQADGFDAAPMEAEAAKPLPRLHGRQSVAMPFFSFAPRG